MKRDMDLIRRLLLYIEENGKAGTPLRLNADNEQQEVMNEHLRLMANKGLIELGKTMTGGQGRIYPVRRITWEGYDFLDAARDEKRWRKATQEVGERVGGLSFDVLTTVLKEIATRAAMGAL